MFPIESDACIGYLLSIKQIILKIFILLTGDKIDFVFPLTKQYITGN